MSIVKPVLKSMLNQFLKLLDEDQLMHFRKIHKPVDELSKVDLISAIELVERTLENSDVKYLYLDPTISPREAVGM